MSGFQGVDDVINAMTVNERMQKLVFQKVIIATTAAMTYPSVHALWQNTGITRAGGWPVNGMGGAVACDVTTGGALKFVNAGSGRTMHLVSGGAYATSSSALVPCTLLLCDRLAHANINCNQATAAFSPIIDGTARLGSTSGKGDGGQIILETTTALPADTFNMDRTFTYTNQNGTGSRVTLQPYSLLNSEAVGQCSGLTMFVRLQEGDRSVRSIESTTLTTAQTTGAFNVVLVKPLAYLPVYAAGLVTGKDFVIEVPTLPKIPDNACLCLYAFASGVLSFNATACIAGELNILEN